MITAVLKPYIAQHTNTYVLRKTHRSTQTCTSSTNNHTVVFMVHYTLTLPKTKQTDRIGSTKVLRHLRICSRTDHSGAASSSSECSCQSRNAPSH